MDIGRDTRCPFFLFAFPYSIVIEQVASMAIPHIVVLSILYLWAFTTIEYVHHDGLTVSSGKIHQ